MFAVDLLGFGTSAEPSPLEDDPRASKERPPDKQLIRVGCSCGIDRQRYYGLGVATSSNATHTRATAARGSAATEGRSEKQSSGTLLLEISSRLPLLEAVAGGGAVDVEQSWHFAMFPDLPFPNVEM